jgi:hypothetical protein
MTVFDGWQNFYVIVGSSAGALIGLQFVVITLIAARPIINDAQAAGAAFATPTIVHFGVVLLLSAIGNMPWNRLSAVSILWGLVALCWIVYVVVVARRMRVQNAYKPIWEDWLFHVLLPLVAYSGLAVSAFSINFYERPALFLVGGAALLLLFIGIHNAWDSVTYHVFVISTKRNSDDDLSG